MNLLNLKPKTPLLLDLLFNTQFKEMSPSFYSIFVLMSGLFIGLP